MDLQVNAIQCKFAKPGLAYELARGDQTDLQVGSQVTIDYLRSTCVDLRWVAQW